MIDFCVSSYSEMEEILTPEELREVSEALSNANEDQMFHIRVECDSVDEDYYYLREVYTMSFEEYQNYLNSGGTLRYYFTEEILGND